LGQVSVRVELVGLVGLEWVLAVLESAPVESELVQVDLESVQVDLGSVLELAEVELALV
jgi:hypothetical protein